MRFIDFFCDHLSAPLFPCWNIGKNPATTWYGSQRRLPQFSGGAETEPKASPGRTGIRAEPPGSALIVFILYHFMYLHKEALPFLGNNISISYKNVRYPAMHKIYFFPTLIPQLAGCCPLFISAQPAPVRHLALERKV